MSNKYIFNFVDSITKIEHWDSVCAGTYPFLRYDFLAALETTGCVNQASGWQPHHLVIKQGGQLVGVLPLYLKYHSYGEYVFDWAWAEAYHRHGLDYYPKLLSAIPYTPATGPRLCLLPDHDQRYVLPALVQAIQTECEHLNASSWHCLFPTREIYHGFSQQGLSGREGCQFHWLNQDFKNFDAFLATFNSRKRKNLKKERQKIAQQAIDITIREGKEITETEWEQFYLFYHLTYFKRSGRQGYLTKDFFLTIGATMPEHMMMVQARHQGKMIAAALCFKSSDTLYGRYWGCATEFDMLHFECCYYQGIAYAINHQLRRFDPGAQGEHKIQRGFTPVKTYSNHWIARRDFRDAIDDFLLKERYANQLYIEDATLYLPFKQNGG